MSRPVIDARGVVLAECPWCGWLQGNVDAVSTWWTHGGESGEHGCRDCGEPIVWSVLFPVGGGDVAYQWGKPRRYTPGEAKK